MKSQILFITYCTLQMINQIFSVFKRYSCSYVLHVASERQSLEEVVRMRTRLEKLTAPVDPPLLHIAAHKTEEKKSSQLSYTTLEVSYSMALSVAIHILTHIG